MEKSAEAFRTISEVADWLGVPTHVLRFWESRFPQVKPVKRAGGRRYYRPADMSLLAGIRVLLHDQGMTIRGVQKMLREQGVKHVAGMCDRELGAEPTAPPPPADPAPVPPAAETTVVELSSAAFADSTDTETAPPKAPEADAQEPLPLFASGRGTAQAAPADGPMATPAAPDPTPPPPAAKVMLPGPSPLGSSGLRDMIRALQGAPDALQTLPPETAEKIQQQLVDLRARLADSGSQ